MFRFFIRCSIVFLNFSTTTKNISSSSISCFRMILFLLFYLLFLVVVKFYLYLVNFNLCFGGLLCVHKKKICLEIVLKKLSDSIFIDDLRLLIEFLSKQRKNSQLLPQSLVDKQNVGAT
jgi:hypothetical protein